MILVGVVSDTHGLLREEVVDALAGSDVILHAGDVGSPEILARLEDLAPVHAVRGNVDVGAWTESLPPWRRIDLEGMPMLLHHGHLDLPPSAARGVRVVVQGHSHRSEISWRNGILYLNPGSAGPRRFRLPVSFARLRTGDGGPHAEIVELPAGPGTGRSRTGSRGG